jgi:hypothetical protein
LTHTLTEVKKMPTDIIPPGLEGALEAHRKNMEVAFAALAGNPYRADEHLNTMRLEIIATAVTLMDNNIPVAIPKKERTLTDVLQEAAAESAMMLGSNAVASGVSFFRNVKENISKTSKGIPKDAEQIIIYEDEETGDLFFYDEHENEVMCDEDGFPIEEYTQEDDANE